MSYKYSKRKMQPRPRPPMPASTPTVPLPASEVKEKKSSPTAAPAQKSFDIESWIQGGKFESGKFEPRCSHDPVEIIEIGGVPIYVADGWGSRKAPAGSVVLNCTGTPKRGVAEMPSAFSALTAHLKDQGVEEITLDWPDGGLPPVKASFWRALIEACAARKAPLVIHCIGGHGRTGTALAAILIAYSIPADDAVEFVREHHCHKAIETLAQERYLDDLDEELNVVEDEPVDFLE